MVLNFVKPCRLKSCINMHILTLPLPALACACSWSLCDIHARKCACVHKNWLVFYYLHVMQVIKLSLLVAFKQPLIIESGICSSVMLMTLNTDFPWVSRNGFQNWGKFHVHFGPTLRI